jgi:opacity protein-like surface antigen
MLVQSLMSVAVAAAALTAAWVGTAAAAEPKRGFYLGLSAGAAIPTDTDFSTGGVNFTLESNPSFAVGAAAGYRFTPNLRAELEFQYSRAEPDRITFPGGSVGVSADVDIYTFTVGGYYDFRLGGGFAPYVGAGAGVAHQSVGTITFTGPGGVATASGGDSTDFTAFGEIGLSWALSDRFELVPSYRFQWINDGGSGADDTMQHIIKLGFRMTF